MDKLAENLQRLTEDDLLQVVQMIHDHKTQESYTKNDVEGTLSPPKVEPAGVLELTKSRIAGEFHVDLYTLPDNLVQMLWTFSEEKVAA